MSGGARLAYVQSRLQARHGRRPTETDWRLLESTDDLAGYLQAGRQTFFREWIEHLGAGANTHQIERSLRHDWVGYCTETGQWLSADWQPGVAWMGSLAYLPMITHLARGEAAWRWMQDDPAMSDFAIQDPEARRAALSRSEYGSLAASLRAGVEPLRGWLTVLQTRAPAGRGAARGQLRDLAALLLAHLTVPAGDIGTSPADRRRPLADALNRRFRSWAGTIGAVFCHLGLIALDAERLRAGLVLRAMIPQAAGRPLWA